MTCCLSVTRAQNHKNVSTTETYIFWIGLFLCPLLWMVFLVTSLLKINFTWMVGRGEGRGGKEGWWVEGRGEEGRRDGG